MSENTEHLMEERFAAYFASVNHLSKKIISDREQIKSKYGESWYNLKEKERDEIFNNYLINTVVGHQYDNYERQTAFDIPETFPKLVLQTGDRFTVDIGDGENSVSVSKATGLTWRDEHSAPFSWKTASQMELSFCNEDDTAATREKSVKIKPTCEQLEECWQSSNSDTHAVYVNPNSSVDTSSVNITSDLLGQISASLAKPPPAFVTENSSELLSEEFLNNSEKSSQHSVSFHPKKKKNQQIVRKPQAPPPAPPKQARSSVNVLSIPEDSLRVDDNAVEPDLQVAKENNSISLITGFDFLDNW